jgi:hypothetical protein
MPSYVSKVNSVFRPKATVFLGQTRLNKIEKNRLVVRNYPRIIKHKLLTFMTHMVELIMLILHIVVCKQVDALNVEFNMLTTHMGGADDSTSC